MKYHIMFYDEKRRDREKFWGKTVYQLSKLINSKRMPTVKRVVLTQAVMGGKTFTIDKDYVIVTVTSDNRVMVMFNCITGEAQFDTIEPIELEAIMTVLAYWINR